MSAPETLTLSVGGLRCQGCVTRLTEGLRAVPGVVEVEVALPGTATVRHDPGLGRERVARAIEEEGFTVDDAGPPEPEGAQDPASGPDVDPDAPEDHGREPASPAHDETEHAGAALPGAPVRVVRVTLPVLGMHCASCVSTVEAELGRVPGVEGAYVNLAAERATVTLAEPIDAAVLRAAVERAGYRAPEADPGESSLGLADRDRAAHTRRLTRRVAVALPLAAVVMVLAMGPMVWPAFPVDPGVSGWIQAVLSGVVLFGPGARFLKGVWRGAVRLRADMDTLVGLGTGAAWLASLVALVREAIGGPPAALYFESTAVIVGLVLLGNLLEARARGRASQALRELVSLLPDEARLADGRSVAVSEVVPGDRLRVRPGDRVPVDGVVLEGRSALDQAVVTGESMPVAVEPGDEVMGGSVNGEGALLVEARRVGADSALGRVVRLVEEAQGSRAPIQRLADRISAVFVPVVVVIASLTAVSWWALGAGADTALIHAVAVLVIACPCALGIATPTAVLVGTGRGARLGGLVRDAASLERTARVDTVIFDKTGTLTEGRPAVVDLIAIDDDDEPRLLERAAAIEREASHPLARALVQAAPDAPPARDIRNHPGRGISGEVDGVRVLVGSRRWMEEEGLSVLGLASGLASAEARGHTVVLVAWEGEVRGLVAVADPLRDESAAAVSDLQALGIRVLMVTGDAPGPAQVVADQVGLTEVVAGALPQDKLDRVAALQGEGRVVAVVGDGVNDAPALARADVGMALSHGAPVAGEAAPITLTGGSPRAVVRALALARQTVATIRQNLAFAFVYNVLGIPLAAGLLAPWGLSLSPMVAGAAMALSSVSVVLNSLRLQRRRLPGARPA